MVTVGYGDFTPVTTYERLYSIINICIATCMYAYTINEIHKTISKYNLLAEKFEEKMKYINKFMR